MFYVWRRAFRARWWQRFAYAPVYVLAAIFLRERLGMSRELRATLTEQRPPVR